VKRRSVRTRASVDARLGRKPVGHE
jgi:hypothetical protein